MLPKKYRLPGYRIPIILQSKNKLVYKEFAMYIQKNKLKNPTTFTFIVPKKISKKAVIRNKIKRILRHTLRTFLPDILPGYEIVIIVIKPIKNISVKLISQSIQYLLCTTGVLKEKNI